MFAEFEQYLRRYTDISAEDIHHIIASAVPRTLKRNEYLLREGEVCRHKVYVIKGLLRNYGITQDGTEHILQFSPEETWTLDVESYDKQAPAQYYISAIEPTQVLLWQKADFDRLLKEVSQLKSLSEQIISRSTHNSRRRLLTVLSGTPEEKYDDFVQSSPNLLNRLPLRMIAAYLGISLKTLNRVRQAQIQR